MNGEEFRAAFVRLSSDAQASWIVRLALALTMHGRSTYEAGTEAVRSPSELRRINEAQHCLMKQLAGLLSMTSKPYPDAAFAEIIFEHAERLNFDLASTRPRRLGFLAGEFAVPDDFDTMGQEEIERMFYGED